MRVTDTHVYFWGSYLSNFFIAPFDLEVGGATYRFLTSEHGFMAFKAVHFGDQEALADIVKAPDGKSAKACGRKVKGFDDKAWSDVSYDYMLRAVRAKFGPEPDLVPARTIAADLIATGTRTIVEASPLDTIWGVGLHWEDDSILDEANWRGENRLGKVLMQVRDELNAAKDQVAD